jgi:hypothetical protein
MKLELQIHDVGTVMSACLVAVASSARIGDVESADKYRSVYNRLAEQTGLKTALPMHNRSPLHG